MVKRCLLGGDNDSGPPQNAGKIQQALEGENTWSTVAKVWKLTSSQGKSFTQDPQLASGGDSIQTSALASEATPAVPTTSATDSADKCHGGTCRVVHYATLERKRPVLLTLTASTADIKQTAISLCTGKGVRMHACTLTHTDTHTRGVLTMLPVTGLKLLASSDPPALVCQSAAIPG
ncbi:hypothetical protein AAY473_027227, partial [Plecturocebus cupreus]